MSFIIVACSLALGAPPVPAGAGKIKIDAGGRSIELFTYRPKSYKKRGPMLVGFHGMLRNAAEYHDNARELGERSGMLIVAPEFDRSRFPDENYRRGGLLDANGRLTLNTQWTWSYLPAFAKEVRIREGSAGITLHLIGHSAGAQFAERLAAFTPTDVRNIVVANAKVHLFPTRDRPFPSEFGQLPDEVSGDELLRRYLRQPITVYLGTADVLRDDFLYVDEDADLQGLNRYDRGRNFYRFAENLARRNGWEFRWRLVEAPCVGHDARAMFDHPRSREALFEP